jgi:hypothetical protein
MLVIVLTLAGPLAVAAGSVIWLPILATEKSLEVALVDAGRYRDEVGHVWLVDTEDCKNLRDGLFVVVGGVFEQRAAAESRVAAWHDRGNADAYLRRCELVVPSRTSVGVPVIDPSFLRGPIDAINWSLADAITRIVPLYGGWIAVIVPRYEAEPEDIREGLRIGVRLDNPGLGRTLELSSDCIDPEIVLTTTHAALTCVSESAGTHLLHNVRLHSLADGRMVAEERRCTNAAFEPAGWSCDKESVDAEGRLRLEPTMIHVE